MNTGDTLRELLDWEEASIREVRALLDIGLADEAFALYFRLFGSGRLGTHDATPK